MTDFETLETDVTRIKLTGLMPDTQYATFITAVIVQVETEIESTNSEELVVWTHPALPAHVEVRIVREDFLEGKLTGEKRNRKIVSKLFIIKTCTFDKSRLSIIKVICEPRCRQL